MREISGILNWKIFGMDEGGMNERMYGSGYMQEFDKTGSLIVSIKN